MDDMDELRVQTTRTCLAKILPDTRVNFDSFIYLGLITNGTGGVIVDGVNAYNETTVVW